MNLLDLLLAVIVGGSVIAGFMSGFTRAAMGLVSAVAGVILGFWFYDVPGAWYVGMTGSVMVANLFGFFTVFLIVLAAGALVARGLSGLFKLVGLSGLDRLLGAGFGLVRGTLVAAAAVAVLIAATPRPVPGWMSGSVLLPYALGASDLASSLAPQVLKDGVSDSVGEIKKAWSEELEKAKRKATGAFTPELPIEVAPQPAPVKVSPVAPKATAKASAKTGKRKAPKGAPPKAVQQ
jgi:membrane protein required for colicin V production